MKVSGYQKRFGVGPLGFVIGLLLVGLLWAFDSRLGHPKILDRPQPIRMLGLILIGLWICWHIWSVTFIRQWWQHDRLCTNGPYRIVRHPMYAGGALLGFPGVSLLYNSWIMLLAPVLFYLSLSFLVRKEERMMTIMFGEKYRQYASRTGRLFPKLF